MSSPLDRIEATVEWAEDNGIYGTTRFLTTDVRALVNVAKAAERLSESCTPKDPALRPLREALAALNKEPA